MLVNSAVAVRKALYIGGVQVHYHWHQTFTSTTVGIRLQRYNKGIIHVRKFCTFDCYDILPALKFDAHEFQLALVSSLMSKAK